MIKDDSAAGGARYVFSPGGDSEEQRRSRRWLCSHMVRIAQRDSTAELIPALLEDVTERGAGLGIDDFVPKGTRVELIADGFRAHGVVSFCRQRESDWHVGVAFDPGHGWHPALWRPDHLYLAPAPAQEEVKAKSAAQSSSGS